MAIKKETIIDVVVPPKKLEPVFDTRPNLGCDPEFFFRQDGEITGSEKVIPKTGLAAGESGESKFVIDGVQAELNPRPSGCRGLLGNDIRECFKTLKTELKRHKGFSVDFSRTVEISKEKLAELDEKSRVFGCAPSKNIYDAGISIDKVDPAEYRVRAAGGHIHLGHFGKSSGWKAHDALYVALTKDHTKVVEMLDIICGNTCVLIDRDASNVERRKVYGRAGEFRLPKHGLEYRTLSNFWLTACPLFSLSFGLARLAVQLIADPKRSDEYYQAFTSAVDQKDVHNAINYNDFNLAMNNFKAIEKLLLEVSFNTGAHPINTANITEFHYFVDKVKSEGLQYWFKDDPMTHWTNLGDSHNSGFHIYSTTTVREDMNKAAKADKKVA